MTKFDQLSDRDRAWCRQPFSDQWRKVATYAYRDLDWCVAFWHVRWASRHPTGRHPDDGSRDALRTKTFRYYQPHPANGQQIVGFDQVPVELRHLIYRLPEIAVDVQCAGPVPVAGGVEPHDVLVICEGEKDVHAVESIGGLATTAHGGAGKWGIEEWRWLVRIGWRGEVWLAIDNDADGWGWLHGMKAVKAWRQLELNEALPMTGMLQCVRAKLGKDPHDAIVTERLGNAWWEVVSADKVVAMGEAVERRMVAGGVGGNGSGSGYLTPAAVAAWKQKQQDQAIASEDW